MTRPPLTALSKGPITCLRWRGGGRGGEEGGRGGGGVVGVESWKEKGGRGGVT